MISSVQKEGRCEGLPFRGEEKGGLRFEKILDCVTTRRRRKLDDRETQGRGERRGSLKEGR